MRLIVTAGPTREFLDDVRFISNPSTGKMGFAIAAAAASAGHQVTLVAGPVHVPTPPGVTRVDVVSTEDMRQATLRAYACAEAVIGAAAPCDYRAFERQSGKMKKSGKAMTLRLAPTPDILAELGRNKGGRVLIGFALESPVNRDEAMRKLRVKNLDAIVLNSPQAFGTERSTAEIIMADGRSEMMENKSKREIGKTLVGLAERLLKTGADQRSGRE
jgi:phosphopantothenoylcysteine decarboxylase / phosphopantothenate---cysteine ligase